MSGKTALHLAAEAKAAECLSLLLKHRSLNDVNAQDEVNIAKYL